ncbi:tRNA-guanine transglycosylase [Sodiomyces alkalinus F11]|uniref:Queuine tRNA-ribosyltransferase accessory subunit 2 n=1 Tax=Sodiomyces alkalinus (strain CBS 110278 / VKM F-3762 / F11) TaxID=1314773 RepID=A0A3N2PXL4_SODAK|nr:tRNA-guanine transglycosylase [Sodiomyces alkalinus F11]ROT39270.1 tRNA-guanine transglycosylase [Sodiomyces alkalinus F11]
MPFRVLKDALTDGLAARLGRLSLPRRRPIETPNFIAVASRGVVPHLTPDNITRHTSFGGAHMALEDFLDKKEPAILNVPPSQSKVLHSFTAFPQHLATVLGPRRCPPVRTPSGNGSKSLTIWTSNGGASLTIAEYATYVEKLQPDIAVGPADLFHTSPTPSKKLVRMAERTEDWMDQFLLDGHGRPDRLRDADVAIFAPVLSAPYPIQWQYLNSLAEDHAGHLSGLALYGVDILPEVTENHESLVPLARLSMQLPPSPQDVLAQVAAGIDVCTIPFVNSASDAGVALAFQFPPPVAGVAGDLQGPGVTAATATPRPLGIDMWSPDHVTSPSPFVEGCPCYACTKHHRAYVHHLLRAHEMLAWTLLQIHNHHVLSAFFESIRCVLETAPGAAFREYVRSFADTYESEIPLGTGTRPRVRGYHFKSEGGEGKANTPRWEKYDENAQLTTASNAHNQTENGGDEHEGQWHATLGCHSDAQQGSTK